VTVAGNSIFTNNTATNNNLANGAAIYTDSGRLSVTAGAVFNNNHAGHYGGAIYSNSIVSVIGSNFFDTDSINDGGAIYAIDGSVDGCAFNNISSGLNGKVGSGGAIYIKNGGSVSNSIFTKISSGTNGGAIFINSGGNGVGGAVCISGIGIVNNSDFINTVSGGNGAIYMTTGNVSDSTFTNTTSQSYGSAIYIYGNSKVSNSTFTNTSSFKGGTVYIKTGSVSDSTFTSTTTNNNGSAIYISGGGNVNISNSNFNSNKADKDGAIYSDGNVNVTGNSNFTNNVATVDGGVIYVSSGSVTCEYNLSKKTAVVFKDNAPNDCNKFINWEGNGNLSFGSLANAIKSSNEVNLTGDVAVYDPEVNVFKEGIVIDHDLVLDGQGHTINARGLARIFKITKGSVTIKNVKLVNGNANNGSAIYLIDSTVNVFASNLSNKVSDFHEKSNIYNVLIPYFKDVNINII
jgi:predicted outer membrane repeat protein